ncbi:MAG: DUF1122 family protein [Promethearchaeota archaeon]
MSKESLLLTLDNRFVDNYQIKVKELSKGRFVEETNFEIYLKNTNGELSQKPAMFGKHFSGRGQFYRPWVEVYFVNTVRFESRKEFLSYETLELLFKEISSLIPSGGKLMIPYIDHETTDADLRHGAPPVTTEIGYLMWKAGCTWFKDWYFSEGAWEGDVKLQGNKPFDEEHRKKNLFAIYEDVSDFLKKDNSGDRSLNGCRKRAKLILDEIKTQFPSIYL